MTIELSQLNMPSVSASGIKLLEILNGDNIDMVEVGDLISQDPVLTSTMLRIANSAMYRRGQDINNVRNAIGMLGAKKVRMAVVVMATRSIESEKSKMQDVLWEHSFGIASLCRLIANKLYPVFVDDIELTGLLHEMGALILVANFPKIYDKLTEAALSRQLPLEDAEKKYYGVDRHDVLMHMSEELHMPAATLEAISRFRQMQNISKVDEPAEIHQAVLMLAHHLDNLANQSIDKPKERVPGDIASLKSLTGLSDEQIDDILEEYENILNATFNI